MPTEKAMYKVVDSRGRVLIPRSVRLACEIEVGDIVRLDCAHGQVAIKKVELIEVGDQSPEALEAYVREAFKTMTDETKVILIAQLSKLLQQKTEG